MFKVFFEVFTKLKLKYHKFLTHFFKIFSTFSKANCGVGFSALQIIKS
ncbi:MAG: hypothetical protein RLZZ306_3048 [Bacteroidota bacterium]